MKAPKILPTLLFGLFLGGAAAASAATADFAGNCTLTSGSTTAFCAFDALRDTEDADPSTCPGSSISAVFWDFGDGTFAWDDTFISHAYPNATSLGGGAVTVRASVFCADNSSADAARFVVFVNIGCPRCINMNNGWD